MLEQEEITDRIIGAAIEVHKKLGPGFVESIVHFAFGRSYLRAVGRRNGSHARDQARDRAALRS